jgi:hypothetical protein
LRFVKVAAQRKKIRSNDGDPQATKLAIMLFRSWNDFCNQPFSRAVLGAIGFAMLDAFVDSEWIIGSR